MTYGDPAASPDTTVLVQAALNDAYDGETIDFRNTYRCDRTLELTGRKDVTLKNLTVICPHPTGDDSTLDAPSRAARNRAHLRITDCTNVKLENVKIIGPGPQVSVPTYRTDLEAQHGIELLGSSVNMLGCTVENVAGDCVYFGRTVNAWSTGTLESCVFRWSGRHGLGITAGKGIWVHNCELGNHGRAIIDLEPNSVKGGCEDIWICHNTIGPSRLLFVAAAGRVGGVNRILVKDNMLSRAMTMRVVGSADAPRRGWQVLDNVSTKKIGAGTEQDPAGVFEFVDVDGIEVRGNTQPIQDGRFMWGVKSVRCDEVAVDGNSFPGGRGEWLEYP